MNADSLTSALATLQCLEGVSGLMLFKGGQILHKNMPFPDEQVLELVGGVEQMLQGYRQARRTMRQVYLEFEGGSSLLVLVKDESVLVFLLSSRADTDMAACAARGLLED